MGAGPRIWTQINQGQFGGPFAHGWSVGGGTGRLEICQKIYMTEFSGQKFYTLKVRKL